jgi:hypothetical protein
VAKPVAKSDLFDDFFVVTRESFTAIEVRFGLSGVSNQLFGDDGDASPQLARLQASPAWVSLDALYEYAVHGICADRSDPGTLVIDGADVLQIISTENSKPREEWEEIVAMADARFALDEGSSVELRKLSLLANVDVRTVRNAISSGELVAQKADDTITIDNASARRWLRGRRSFQPTIESVGAGAVPIGQVETPAAFGRFLQERRKCLGHDGMKGKLVVRHAAVTASTLDELEAGVFAIPLDAVFPLADFYQVPHKDLLDCVMRVFFPIELETLRTHVEGREQS